MSRRIPWGKVFAEGLVIIASILIAFGIDAWWAEHRQGVDERAALARVHDELVRERERILMFEGAHDAAANASLALVALIDDLGDGSGTIDVLDRQLAFLIRLPSWETETPTLDGLLRSGGIDLISDPGVRAAIARWDSRVQDTRTHEAAAGQLVNSQLLPALISRGDLGHLLLNISGRVRLAELGAADITTIHVDSEIKALIARRYTASALLRAGLEESRTALDSAVIAIAAHR